jgi:hypothetical protein
LARGAFGQQRGNDHDNVGAHRRADNNTNRSTPLAPQRVIRMPAHQHRDAFLDAGATALNFV